MELLIKKTGLPLHPRHLQIHLQPPAIKDSRDITQRSILLLLLEEALPAFRASTDRGSSNPIMTGSRSWPGSGGSYRKVEKSAKPCKPEVKTRKQRLMLTTRRVATLRSGEPPNRRAPRQLPWRLSRPPCELKYLFGVGPPPLRAHPGRPMTRLQRICKF